PLGFQRRYPSFTSRTIFSSRRLTPLSFSPTSSPPPLSMSPPPTSPTLSIVQRFMGRKPAPIADEEGGKFDEKYDEKAVDIDFLPEVDDGLQTDEAYAFMASHSFRTCVTKRWLKDNADLPDAVAVRRAKRDYVVHPPSQTNSDFNEALNGLNCEIAATVSASVVSIIVAAIPPEADVFSVTERDHIQVVDTMLDLARARAAQHACFIRNEKRLVIWADKVNELETTIQEIEMKLVHYVFNRTLRRTPQNRSASTFNSTASTPSRTPALSQSPSFAAIPGSPSAEQILTASNEKHSHDVETGEVQIDERRLPLNHSIYTGLGTALNFVLCGLLARSLLTEAFWDKQYINLAILAVIPFLFCICMFFTENIISIVTQLLAPVGVLGRNSLYYSAVPPARNYPGQLPHVTIMMPVYKEELEEVLAPTIESVSDAIRTYELQGGTASIVVCEDGMQLVDAAEVEKRKEYYDKWHCAFVARPKENRAGRFKKSSNMNTTLALSLRIEDIMDERRPTDLDDLAAWTSADEDRLYEAALATALDEGGNILWANGNIRIGEYILIIDSDTRVPRDCLLDGACEMAACPEVGVIQHASGTFLAGAGYFENFIAFFTTSVNHAISYCTANGATAPFVGHNAFLRWSALQHQALTNPEGKVWSEEHVSEDFVMTLCLNRAGYITRWATYSNNEFKEGVSLTCDDELNRWQKYAFGCSEMVFNPLKTWYKKGPFSPLYQRYLKGDTPLPTKVSASAYVASYWAIACAPPLTLANYICDGWFGSELSAAFMPNFKVWIAVMVVFSAGGTIATMFSRYRSQAATLRVAVFEGLFNIIPAVIFFSGIAFHVLTALLAHITSYNMQWGATLKSLDNPTLAKELPSVGKRHWLTWLLSLGTIAGVVVLSTDLLPVEWRIEKFTVIFPLLWLCAGHALYPILLNPAIMLFRF
ncbi:hypothetical protein JCM8547_006817, partial [Rhodosporidiobolus lusitaniae]